MFKDILAQAMQQANIALNEHQLMQFVLYEEMLLDWNRKMNLTALTEPKDIAVKHFVDSLTVWEEESFRDGTRVIDIGTGAGFPGLPLAIFRPTLRIVLMDSLAKRVKFLEAVVNELGLKNVTYVHSRAEDAAHDSAYREQFDVAVSRAVARLSVLTEYTLPFICIGGVLLAMKGRDAAIEAKEAKCAISMLGGELLGLRTVHLPDLADERAILAVRKARPTPKAYPRKAGTPAKKPL